jgi:hypothetical protein
MATKISSALGGGLVGACILTLLHEGIKKLDHDTSSSEALGMNALSKILKGFKDAAPAKQQELFDLTPAGEILTNAIYFSIAGVGSKKNIVLRSALLGLTAGLGALVLPHYLGVDEDGRSNKQKILTVSRYLLGSLLTGAAIHSIEKTVKKNGKALTHEKIIDLAL